MKPILLSAAAAGLPSIVSSEFHRASPSSAFLSPYGRPSQNIGRGFFAMVPTSASGATPGKGDLYGDEELFELLALHRSIANPERASFGSIDAGDSGNLDDGPMISGGIHDWVLQALEIYGPTPSGGIQDCLVLPTLENDAYGSSDGPISGGIHDWVLQTLENDGPTLSGIQDWALPTVENDSGGSGDLSEGSISGGIHDWVLQTLENDAGGSGDLHEGQDDSTINQLAYDNLRTLLRDRKPSIRAIATDVDGTLLSGRYLHPTTRDAVLRGIRQAYESGAVAEGNNIRHFFPATGKTRAGAMKSLGPEIGPLLLKCPGVYVQGLYCVDGDGNVVFERKLPRSAVRAAAVLAAEYGISIVAYDGDAIYTTNVTKLVVHLSKFYGEPTVDLLIDERSSRAMELADHGPGLHKLILMDEDLETLAMVRLRLEELAETHNATVTQALPTMLELLPAGCSKAYGVARVCEALGVNPAVELIALGDAENDSGMLRMASIGVAVGNACPQAREAADFVMRERHDEGGAGLAMNLFGF